MRIPRGFLARQVVLSSVYATPQAIDAHSTGRWYTMVVCVCVFERWV